MPFADDGGLVSGFLEQFWKCLLVAIKKVAVSDESVHVVVFASLDHGAAWATDGVTDICLVEHHSFVGDAVEPRGIDELAAIGAGGLYAVVIHEDEKDIWAFLSCLCRAGKQEDGGYE